MEEHNFDSLPSEGILRSLGHSPLSNAIYQHHGGSFPVFREILANHLGQKPEKDCIEELLEDYVNE